MKGKCWLSLPSNTPMLMDNQERIPKLKTVNKVVPPFGLNDFPADFPYKLAQELVYLLATKGQPDLEGSEWEAIFAKCINGEWKPSNVGLDDVLLGNTAWSAKSVKSANPSKQDKIRLISGRNSLVYSYGEMLDTNADPNPIGQMVLNIWNDRVSAIRQIHKHLRTVVLVKSKDLTHVAVFEFDTIRYDPELYYWEWNNNNNLCGYDKRSKEQHFTWQPHGSQFTIHEKIPQHALNIQIKQPPKLEKDKVLQTIGFDQSWVTVTRRKGGA